MDFDEAKSENEFELCRFHLRPGAELRFQYKGFSDMGTEYDTINLIYADWGGLHGKTLAPVITRNFAEVLIRSRNSQPEDVSFACLCLDKSDAVPKAVLRGYLTCKTGELLQPDIENMECYKAMCFVADHLQEDMKKERERKERHKILVD